MIRTVIVAKGGAGKDFLKSKLIDKGYKKSTSFTTRPPREGEVNHEHYHFVSEAEFDELRTEGTFLETDCFNGWYYGTSFQEFTNGDSRVFIMTPRGISKIPEYQRKNTLVIYLDIDLEVRKERLSKRPDADKADRRLAADEEDFKNFKDFDIKITNSDF